MGGASYKKADTLATDATFCEHVMVNLTTK